MDKVEYIKRILVHDGLSQFVSNENPRRFENVLIMANALASLHPWQRSIIEMWSLGYTQEDIAEHFGSSRTTVGYRIREGIELLREELEGCV